MREKKLSGFLFKTFFNKHFTPVTSQVASSAFSSLASSSFFSRLGSGKNLIRSYSKGKNISYSITNDFINIMDQKVKTKYDNLPNNSILKHPSSLVTLRISMSTSDIIKTLYGLEWNFDVKYYFYIPEKLNIPGIYVFLSKDGKNFYIGSSMNMKARYNRHMFNLKQSNERYSQANPKFYNYINKYGIEQLEFGCLLAVKNYPEMCSGFNLSDEEISLLKSLVQLDLLITEQFFLDTLGLSLNIAPKVGTRESSILSVETRNKMSIARLNSSTIISKEKWKIIRAKALESWNNDELNSDRRESISKLHGKAVIIKNSNGNIIGEFLSNLKAAEYLGVSRAKVKTYLDSGNLLDSKLGLVRLIDNSNSKQRAIEVQVLDKNKTLLDTCSSLRVAGKKYAVTATAIRNTYLDKDKLCKGKYYFKRRPLEVTNKKVLCVIAKLLDRGSNTKRASLERKYSTSSRQLTYTYEPFIRELSNNQFNQLPNRDSRGFVGKVLNMTKWTIISKYSVILPAAPARQSSTSEALRRINYFVSSVTYLNNLFASFVNKLFFISKSDIDNNFEFIIYCISLFGAMAVLCTGCISFTFIIPCFILSGFIMSNNYITIKRKVVDRLYLLFNIGILTFITGLILCITAGLFVVVSGVDLGLTFSGIYNFSRCLFGYVLSTILLLNVISDNITLYCKYTGKDYRDKFLRYFWDLIVSLSILALLSMVFSVILASVVFVLVSFVSDGMIDVGILNMDSNNNSGNDSSGGQNQSGSGKKLPDPKDPKDPNVLAKIDNYEKDKDNSRSDKKYYDPVRNITKDFPSEKAETANIVPETNRTSDYSHTEKAAATPAQSENKADKVDKVEKADPAIAELNARKAEFKKAQNKAKRCQR